MAYAGVPKATIAFLRDLASHNDRAWFEAHRDRYEEAWLAPAIELTEVLGDRLQILSPDVAVEPKVNGSIARINRDIRFSKDKRPYKDHIDLLFWEGRDKKGSPSYWFRLTAKSWHVGVGMYGFDERMLTRYRDAVVDDRSGAELEKIIAKLERGGYELYEGGALKRVPKGFDPEHPRADLLRYRGMAAGTSKPVTAEVSTAKFPTVLVGHYRKLQPLQAWLVDLAR
jgi:uncharacterized protein (TIGR02453 family)